MGHPGYAYDAVSMLGFGEPRAVPQPPRAVKGEIAILYGGSSLQALRGSPIGQKLMHQQEWYDRYPWSSEELPAGVYHLRIPVPESNRKTASEQEQILLEGELMAPVILVASALLAHRLQTGEDLLKT